MTTQQLKKIAEIRKADAEKRIAKWSRHEDWSI